MGNGGNLTVHVGSGSTEALLVWGCSLLLTVDQMSGSLLPRLPAQHLYVCHPLLSGNPELWRPLSDRLDHFGARRFLGWPGFGPTPPQPGITRLTDLVQLAIQGISSPVTLLAQSMVEELPSWPRLSCQTSCADSFYR